MPAAIPSPLRRVEWTRTTRAAWSKNSCDSSGDSRIAAVRGSAERADDSGSFATSSDWTTTRTGPSSGSTSYMIAAVERWTQDTGAEVELALVREQPAVAQVERLVVDEQADDLAVGDVDDRLARLRVPVGGFRLRERAELVERVQVRPRQAERLALVQVRAEPDMPVREREHRLRLCEHVEVEVRLAHRPRLDRERGMRDHLRSSSSARSETTMSAPRSRSAFACPLRSTPTTKPNRPARAASTPASASSNTAASAGSTPSARAAARNVSGAGFPRSRSRSATTASIRTSNSSSIAAASITSRQFALEETTAVRSPASRTACT